MARSNVYERPTGCGFHCGECGSEEAPLFGFENRGQMRYRDFTFCLPHVILMAEKWGKAIRPDKELKARGFEFIVPDAVASR